MYWKIEYVKWEPFKSEEDYVGGFDEKEEICNSWDKTLERFNELIKDDNIPQVYVTTYWNNRVYDPDNPYVLTYDAG